MPFLTILKTGEVRGRARWSFRSCADCRVSCRRANRHQSLRLRQNRLFRLNLFHKRGAFLNCLLRRPLDLEAAAMMTVSTDTG